MDLRAAKSALRWILAGGSLAVALSGCAALEYHATAASLQAQCQKEAEAKWLKPVPRLHDLLFIAEAADPHGGVDVTPIRNANNADDLLYVKSLFSATGLDTIYMYIAQIGPSERQVFGVDAAPGVYEIRVLPRNSTECRAGHVVREEGYLIDGLPPRANSETTCLSARYVGGLDFLKYDFVFVNHYLDDSVQQPITKHVQEFRDRFGTVYARSVNYGVFYGYSANSRVCEDKSDIYQLMYRDHAGQEG
jgi:hypothetical protein